MALWILKDGGQHDAAPANPGRLMFGAIAAIALLAISVIFAVFYSVNAIDRASIAEEQVRARAALAAVGTLPDLIERLQRDFMLDGARLTNAAGVADNEASIELPGSEVVVAWTPTRLGSNLMAQLAPVRIAVSALFLFGIAAIVRRFYRMAGELERKRREAQQLAMADPLTGVGNRLAFDSWMTAGRDRGVIQVGLLYLDIDDFKSINDKHGHGVGDEVLRAVALRLAALSASGDMVARIGGDEFAFIRPGPIDRAELAELAADIGTRLSEPVRIGPLTLSLATSVGVALGAPGSTELVAGADAALYRAKVMPGHTFVISDAA